MSMDPDNLLLKGLEEEAYTGTPDGHAVGMAKPIKDALPGFATEPDNRNVEYTTEPARCYVRLFEQFMDKRLALRKYLAERGDYTILPGGCIPLDEPEPFRFSDPDNPYYRHIRDRHGTDVVTASGHLNIGIGDVDALLRACRVVRCEAALFLALSAASPLIGGKVTGDHSTRWRIFPKTPAHVPLFTTHRQFIDWAEARIAAGDMYNVRHLWVSVRPNGPRSPYELTRLELRICDRIAEPCLLQGMTALLEARVWQILEDPSLDPLANSPVGGEEALIEMCAENERAAAHRSLDATFTDWRTGRQEPVRDRIERYVEQVRPAAEARGFDHFLRHIETVLREGNTAMQWLARIEAGQTPQQVIAEATAQMAEADAAYPQIVC